MGNQVKVSVIVPAFNAQDTIVSCLDSLSCQTLDSIEIIVINDGSTDSTLDIVSHYRDSSHRSITVINQINMGPSAARNAGLEVAQGEFVAFADSDDVVDKTAYEKMYLSAVEFGADIVTCGRSSYDSLSRKLIRTKVPKYEVIRGSLTEVPQITKRVGPLMCDKLFRRSIIEEHHIRFAEDLFHAEDFLFTSEVRLYVNCVSAVRESLYKYYINSFESISGGNAHVLDIPEACCRVVELYKTHGVFDVTSRYLLFVFMGYYLRKRGGLPRFSRIRRTFSKEFVALFRTNFPDSWKKMRYKRSKAVLENDGLWALIKLL